jgi:hypothetical protein
MEKRVGFGAHKLELKWGATREDRIQRARDMLSRVLNLRSTVAFVGAGCSVPLGYPTWKQFAKLLVAHTIENCPSLPGDSKTSYLNLLLRFQTQLESESIRPHQIMFILGECKKVFEHCQGMKKYYRFLKTTFKPRDHEAVQLNPYDALLDLPIKRFITTNYDREIEIALVKKELVPREEFDLHRKQPVGPGNHRDFTQEAAYNDQLALFALTRVEEADYMVFHCHGHYNHPKSLVVTEEDYQRWYLAEERTGGIAFRQTVSLLLGSNPILFVGYAMGDDDLLGTLRMFNSVEPERKSSRPLFALMPEHIEGEDEDDYRFLYERYGVNVIPYLSPTDADRGQALFNALETVKKSWTDWRTGWLQKPRIRKIQIAQKPPEPYHHYPLVSTQMPDFGGERVRELLEDLRQKAEEGSHLIALVGPGGTGKSWHAQQLLEVVQTRETRFRGFFFWSSYYADDSLTGLDRALSYLGRERGKGSRVDRFEECLRDRDKPCFLVFDGIERFLRPTANPDEGSAFDPNTTSFLAAMAHKDNHSTVVLTSRLWPEVFKLPEFLESKIRRMPVPRFTTCDIDKVPPFNWFEDREQISALCSLLDGHIYGLVLAARMITAAGKAGSQECLQRIRRALSYTPPLARTSKMIGESIAAIDEDWNGLALKLLERLAVFMRPVTDATLTTCYESALQEINNPPPEGDMCRLVDALLSGSLLHRVQGGTDHYAYTVHPTVRGYVYQRIHHASTDLIPNFTLPGFTAGTATVDPGSSPESAAVVIDIFNRLHEAAEAATKREDGLESARELSRAAFGVVRSRMEANTSPRWTTYDDYLRILIKIGNLAKTLSPRLWDYAERHDIQAVENKVGPFYADELAWLYNEIGLTSYAEGTMLDAYAVWEQGYEINRVIDSFDEGGRYLFQSLCNLGAVYVHYGHLNTAELYLRQAEHINYYLKDEDHAGRITGYLGLVQHLRGDMQQADEKYAEALEKLKLARNPRAESIFLRHRADLKIQQNDLDMASRLVQTSRSLAEAERYPELIAYARLCLGHVYRKQKEYPKAQREYNAVYDEGRRIGMRRLQAEALTELSRLAMDLGDAQVARERAIESLRIANELVLGLRQTHDLVVLGLATIETGQADLGVAYLRHAKKIAERQEYRLRAYETEEHLQKYGEVDASVVK